MACWRSCSIIYICVCREDCCGCSWLASVDVVTVKGGEDARGGGRRRGWRGLPCLACVLGIDSSAACFCTRASPTDLSVAPVVCVV